MVLPLSFMSLMETDSKPKMMWSCVSLLYIRVTLITAWNSILYKHRPNFHIVLWSLWDLCNNLTQNLSGMMNYPQTLFPSTFSHRSKFFTVFWKNWYENCYYRQQPGPACSKKPWKADSYKPTSLLIKNTSWPRSVCSNIKTPVFRARISYWFD